MIVCARHTHIALSDGDECGDDAISIPREDVPALIEALEKVTKEAPKCGECDTLGVYLCQKVFGDTITVHGKTKTVQVPDRRDSEMTDKNFLGIPVEGNILAGGTRRKQRPAEELAPAFAKVFANVDIEAVRWTQYTPYFNDGDECVFSVDGLEILLADEELRDYDHLDGLGFIDWWSLRYAIRNDDFDHPELGNKVLLDASDLADELDSGGFNDALREAFGDHAIVTATRESFTVDYYDHD